MREEKHSTAVKKTVTTFVYVERIKSELIIASRLLEEIQNLKGNENEGAEKLILAFLNALQGETQIAYNVSGEKNFEQATMRVWEATDARAMYFRSNFNHHNYRSTGTSTIERERIIIGNLKPLG